MEIREDCLVSSDERLEKEIPGVPSNKKGLGARKPLGWVGR
jgi:hypothetical protein